MILININVAQTPSSDQSKFARVGDGDPEAICMAWQQQACPSNNLWMV